MDKESIIVVTGAAGFIGSCMVSYLNEQGFKNLILVDEFSAHQPGGSDDGKELNLHEKNFLVRVERHNFFEWLKIEEPEIKFIFHLGAKTDTTEFDYSIHQQLNVDYSQYIWDYCTQNNIPLVYASSAATYGSGSLGYNDDQELIEKLQPLNPYGVSKNEFDKWALRQNAHPPLWAGLKFYNVYGPNEYHKARMASMVFHSFNQIKKNGFVKLFKSNSPEYKDGEQLRDFIYVKDVTKVCYWFLQNRQQVKSGIYNLGTGKARSFNDLVTAVFAALQLPPKIEYIPMPEDIKDKYQNFTEANMQKLKEAGYSIPFYSLEDGVKEYVKSYLERNSYY